MTCFFCGQAANQRWMSGYNIYGGISMAEKVEVSWVIIAPVFIIDIEYNKRLDRQRPCLEGDLTAGSNL